MVRPTALDRPRSKVMSGDSKRTSGHRFLTSRSWSRVGASGVEMEPCPHSPRMTARELAYHEMGDGAAVALRPGRTGPRVGLPRRPRRALGAPAPDPARQPRHRRLGRAGRPDHVPLRPTRRGRRGTARAPRPRSGRPARPFGVGIRCACSTRRGIRIACAASCSSPRARRPSGSTRPTTSGRPPSAGAPASPGTGGVRAMERLMAGDVSAETRLAAAPFAYGRWTEATAAHAASGATQRSADGGRRLRRGRLARSTAERTGPARVAGDAPALIIGGELDLGPTPRLQREMAALFRDGRAVDAAGQRPLPVDGRPGRLRRRRARVPR